MQMLSKKSVAGLVVILFAATCVGFGSWFHNSTERGTNVTFSFMTKFSNGETLPAGTYHMEVPDNSQKPAVTFSQDGKVMATVKAKVVTEPKKNGDTEVDSVTEGSAQAVTAIRPSGWEEKLVFGSAGE